MFEEAMATVTGLRGVGGRHRAPLPRGEDASRLLVLFAKAQRLAGMGKSLLARRVEETSLHRREGHRRAADCVAAKTGTSAARRAGSWRRPAAGRKLPATAQADEDGAGRRPRPSPVAPGLFGG